MKSLEKEYWKYREGQMSILDPVMCPEKRWMEMKQRVGDQKLPAKNRHKPVIDRAVYEIECKWMHGTIAKKIIRKLKKRSELGLKRYGTYLQPFNGRDTLRDLQEELLDAYMYSIQDKIEGEKEGTPRGTAWTYTEILDVIRDVEIAIGEQRINRRKK